MPRTGWCERQRAGLQTQVRKYFSMTRASSIAATMLTCLEAAGRERQLVAGSANLTMRQAAVVRVWPPRLSAEAARTSNRSDLGLLRDLQGIVDLDAEIPHSGFQLGVSEEQLDRAQVLGSTVDQRRLRPAHRVRTVLGAV